METIRFKNYRCFDDTKEIEIKPLTFLLGSNSSGKSSFLKFFPLLKQSMGLRRNGTFLWLGNDVDFKDFNNTVKDGRGNMTIEFSFHNFKCRNFTPFDEDVKHHEGCTMHVRVVLASKDDRYDYIKEFYLEYLDQKIKVSCRKNNAGEIEVNGFKMPDEVKSCMVFPNSNLLPDILFPNKREKDQRTWSSANMWARKQIEDIIGKDKEFISKFRYNDYRTPLFMTQEDFAELVKSKHKRLKEDQIKSLNDYYILIHLNNIIDGVNDGITSLCARMSYVKPLRATTDRYYRYQNYAIDEIDSDGKNLAMYLANLSDSSRQAFSDWLNDLFDFKLQVTPIEGHVVINVEEKDKPLRNIVDVGFGYTQILPVVAIIWKALEIDSRPTYHSWVYDTHEHLVIIEQPELHLHPKMQGRFAEMLLKVLQSARKKNRDIRFVIETHSDVMINKIGELLTTDFAESSVHADDTNVVLFNVKSDGKGYVETTSYNSDGSLKYWPLGFLSAYAD